MHVFQSFEQYICSKGFKKFDFILTGTTRRNYTSGGEYWIVCPQSISNQTSLRGSLGSERSLWTTFQNRTVEEYPRVHLYGWDFRRSGVCVLTSRFPRTNGMPYSRQCRGLPGKLVKSPCRSMVGRLAALAHHVTFSSVVFLYLTRALIPGSQIRKIPSAQIGSPLADVEDREWCA